MARGTHFALCSSMDAMCIFGRITSARVALEHKKHVSNKTDPRLKQSVNSHLSEVLAYCILRSCNRSGSTCKASPTVLNDVICGDSVEFIST